MDLVGFDFWEGSGLRVLNIDEVLDFIGKIIKIMKQLEFGHWKFELFGLFLDVNKKNSNFVCDSHKGCIRSQN